MHSVLKPVKGGLGGGGGQKVINFIFKNLKKTHGAFIQGTGVFSDVSGTPPRSLLPWLFVAGQSRAWEQSWKRLRNQTAQQNCSQSTRTNNLKVKTTCSWLDNVCNFRIYVKVSVSKEKSTSLKKEEKKIPKIWAVIFNVAWRFYCDQTTTGPVCPIK